MPTTHQLLSPPAPSTVQNQLHVSREGITWQNVAPDRVRIDVTVTNASLERSRRTVLRLQAAPFGVFLPWQDLTVLAVPPLGPGESTTLSAEVSSPPAEPLGRFDQVPPERLLTALEMSDEEERKADSSLFNRRRTERARPSRARRPGAGNLLPPDLLGLVGQTGLHWAGNFNILLGTEAVERHMAQAVRIYPGRTNLALFIVGSAKQEKYSFQLQGDGAEEWGTQLAFMGNSGCADCETIPLSQWVQCGRCTPIMLAMLPPESCERGEIQVHVQQRSTGKTALVEFSLDATAAGPGCYVV